MPTWTCTPFRSSSRRSKERSSMREVCPRGFDFFGRIPVAGCGRPVAWIGTLLRISTSLSLSESSTAKAVDMLSPVRGVLGEAAASQQMRGRRVNLSLLNGPLGFLPPFAAERCPLNAMPRKGCARRSFTAEATCADIKNLRNVERCKLEEVRRGCLVKLKLD